MIMESIKGRVRTHIRAIVTSAAGDIIEQYRETASVMERDKIARERLGLAKQDANRAHEFRKSVLGILVEFGRTHKLAAERFQAIASALAATASTLVDINNSMIVVRDMLLERQADIQPAATNSRGRVTPAKKKRAAAPKTKRTITKKKRTRRGRKS